ncbi:amidohydrolase family protein [Rheinheimera sp.]|uniref:Xaa-Pro dipeptidase n=1 Tax=Rheinheimera sp. TaxID=1869214 RepID=UPI0026206D66|nr:amidohydrolase family protein [Rheinheimera sp.]MCA1930336.1 amidohydrolase family protein [Rheinheimera sp.]
MCAQVEQVILVGQLLDVRTGNYQKNKAILVEAGRISAIVDLDQAPATVPTIDLSTYYVLPGLIDMHVHLTSDPQKHGYRGLVETPTREAIFGVSAAKATLKAGFTTVRNLGAAGFADVSLRDAIEDGEIQGPRMRVAANTICITGGHCDNNLLPHIYNARSAGVANGPDEVRAKVRENIKYGADVIKFAATGGVLSKNTDVNASQYNFEEMKALIDEAHDRGRIVAAHAHGLQGIKRAIEAGVDSIEHGSFIDDEAIKLAKKHGTYLVMDVYVSDYILSEGEKAGILPESLAKEKKVGLLQRQNFQKAVKAGVKMAYGTDAGVYTHGLNGRQFAYMTQWGMTPLQAIQAATLNAGTLLNWKNEQGLQNVGVLEVGAFADLIAVPRDPLKDITVLEQPALVVKSGQQVL